MARRVDIREGKSLEVVDGEGHEGTVIPDSSGEAALVGGLAARCGSLSLAGDLEVGGFKLPGGSGSSSGGGGTGLVLPLGGLGIYVAVEDDGGNKEGLVGGLTARCGSLSLAGELEAGGFKLPGSGSVGGGSETGMDFGCNNLNPMDFGLMLEVVVEQSPTILGRFGRDGGYWARTGSMVAFGVDLVIVAEDKGGGSGLDKVIGVGGGKKGGGGMEVFGDGGFNPFPPA